MSACNFVEQKLIQQVVTISGQSWTYLSPATMPRGQPVSEAIQWTIIRLSAVMPSHEISGFTDISDRKVRDILSHFKKTGDIKSSKRGAPTIHRSFQEEDVQVWFTFELLTYADLGYKASLQHSWYWTRSVSRWVTVGASRGTWGLGIYIHNLEDTQKGRLYYEKGALCNHLADIVLTLLNSSLTPQLSEVLRNEQHLQLA